MRRLLALLLVLPACKEPDHAVAHRAAGAATVAPAADDASVRAAVPGDASVRAAVPRDASVRAAVPRDAAVDALSPRVDRARLAAYLELLSIDRWTYQLLATFPDAPQRAQFFSLTYSQWGGEMWLAPETLRDHLAKLRQAADRAPRMAVDNAVAAYLEVQGRWLDKVLDLHAYYRGSRFIDDEFDRARREAPDIAAAGRALAAVRGALWQRVLEAWRELSGDVPDSPLAIIGRAWEACFRVQEVIMTERDENRVLVALSACRRSIPTVTALPPALRGHFDDLLRDNAITLGDHLDPRLRNQPATSGLATLTNEYLALWPTLPTAPAERAAP